MEEGPTGGAAAGDGLPPTGGVSGAVGGSAPEVGGSGGTSPGEPGITPGSGGSSSGPGTDEVVRADFEAIELGNFSEGQVGTVFGRSVIWSNGLDEGRAKVEAETGNQFLRVHYPASKYGPSQAGVQFEVQLGKIYHELYFSYRLRLSPSFEFAKGGKLPGLAGGSVPSGCQPDSAGFSARNMWREGGALVKYLYYPEQPDSCGDDLAYTQSGQAYSLPKGKWVQIQHRVKMNQAGASDGVVEGWVDGIKSLLRSGIVLRTSASAGIDVLYFSTFYGGNDASWAPSSATYADFDDLVVTLP